MASTPNQALLLRLLKEDGIQEIYRCSDQAKLQEFARTGNLEKTAPSCASGLSKLQTQVTNCFKCGELSRQRTQTVFGIGNPHAKLMFVGEAPGADEDEQGLPFVGKAGQLLTKIIESIGLNRDEVYIANVLKCRPPGNRQPALDEIANCSPFLKSQIENIRPMILCALGSFAAQTLLQTTISISQLRGKFYNQNGYRLICTYHPAYLLRNPTEKRAVWEDMKLIKRELEGAA